MVNILEFLVGIVILIGVFLLTQRIILWRLKRTCDWILKDLEKKGALDSNSAVPLPYARKDMLRIGVRDYRPKAMEALLMYGKVAMNDAGAFYLPQGKAPDSDS